MRTAIRLEYAHFPGPEDELCGRVVERTHSNSQYRRHSMSTEHGIQRWKWKTMGRIRRTRNKNGIIMIHNAYARVTLSQMLECCMLCMPTLGQGGLSTWNPNWAWTAERFVPQFPVIRHGVAVCPKLPEYRALANALSVDISDKRETVKESEKKSDDDDNENKTKNENIPHFYAIRNRKE